MSSFLPVLLLGVAGLLVGGAVSVYRQGGSRGTVGVLGVLGVIAAAAGILWLVPE